jgi:hypothetical protein
MTINMRALEEGHDKIKYYVILEKKSLDEASGIVHYDHRDDLLPILMRILYGKFHSNETTHTSSRDTKKNKRSTIIQFLSSCSEKELGYFFNLLFDCLNVAIGIGDTSRADHELVGRILLCLNDRRDSSASSSLYNLTKVIPLKKILGILQSLEIIINKLARQMELFAHRILLMLGFINKYSMTLNETIQTYNTTTTATKVDDYHLNLLKIIRQQVTLRFKQVKTAKQIPN